MADNKKTSMEEVLQQYADQKEGVTTEATNEAPVNIPEPQAPKVPTSPEEVMRRMQERDKPARTMSAQELFAQRAKDAMNRPSMQEAHAERMQEIREEQQSQGLGFIEIPLDSLPTGGMFYPEGTKIFVKAAEGGDIRHWSMTNEQELTEIDEALNKIFQRCVRISFPAGNPIATWEDIKEIDRFYLILAVRDFTWRDTNKLMIQISENKEVEVHKDDISFIDLGEKLLKYFNPEKRCFTFDVKNPKVGQLNFYMPSIGVSRWVKSYIQKKSQRQEPYDKDFIQVAPILIKDFRQLNDASYRQLIENSMNFGDYEWTLISKVRSIFENAVSPKLIYHDETGAEQETPLYFRGGLKALFTLNLDEIDL